MLGKANTTTDKMTGEANLKFQKGKNTLQLMPKLKAQSKERKPGFLGYVQFGQSTRTGIPAWLLKVGGR